MHTNRPLATKKELLGLATLVAIIAAFFVTPLASAVGAVANEYVFNPEKLDPYRGLRPGITVTSEELAASSPEPVSTFEWHDAYSMPVTNTGGLTLGALYLDTNLNAPAGKSQADATWVRITQDGQVIMPATRLSEMERVELRVPATGFKPGEETTLVVQMKTDQELYQQEAYHQAIGFSFTVSEALPFKPGQDHYEPATPQRGGVSLPNLGGHDAGR